MAFPGSTEEWEGIAPMVDPTLSQALGKDGSEDVLLISWQQDMVSLSSGHTCWWGESWRWKQIRWQEQMDAVSYRPQQNVR